MPINLGELSIPIRETGRERVLKAFDDIDRAAKKAGLSADMLNAAMLKLNRTVGSSNQYGSGMDVLTKRITALQRGAQIESTRAESVRRLQIIERAFERSLARTNLSLSEQITLETQLGRVRNTLSTPALSSQASGIKRVTSGVAQLAVSALGARSAVGSLAVGGLAAFGASAGLTLAVVAGTALIAAGYNAITKSSREAKEKVKELREELEKPTEQQTVANNRGLIQAALTDAEKKLAEAKGGSDLSNLAGVPHIVDEKRVAKAQALVDALRRDLEKLGTAARDLDTKGTDESIETLTKAVELRTASAHQIRQAIGLLPILKAQSEDESKTLIEQNHAREQYNALVAAFKSLSKDDTDARKKALDAMRDESALMVELSQQRTLTSAEVTRLRGVYNDLTTALEKTNLTDRERLDLIRAQTAALAELARQTSTSFTTKGSTFGQSFGRSKTPGLDQIKFGPDGDTTSDFFAGGAGADFQKDVSGVAKRGSDAVRIAIDEANENLAQGLDDMRTRLAEGLTQSLVEGIATGFETAVATGSIENGAKTLLASLLNGLGDAAISFGVASLGIAKLMQAIKSALSSLNPALAIPAAIGLIALGGLLKGAASRMFSGGGGGGGSVSVGGGSTTSRITVGADGGISRQSQPVPDTAAPRASKVEPRPMIAATFQIFGKDDLQYQRHLVETANLAFERGYKIKRGG